MTTDEPDRLLTAADLLFGTSANTPKALASQIMSAGDTKGLGRALAHLPRVTREAAAREAAAAAAGLLKIDLIELLVAGWREHREIIAAARRTLVTPDSRELVGLGAHRVTTVQQPAVGILLDGRRVHTLQLGVSIIFDVTALVAGVSVGRLTGLHSGRCDVGVALTVHDVEVLTKRAHLELPGVKALRSGVRLLPASEYPADMHQASTHLDGAYPAVHPDSQFPAVELVATEHPSSTDPDDVHPDGADLGGEHSDAGYFQPQKSQGLADHPHESRPVDIGRTRRACLPAADAGHRVQARFRGHRRGLSTEVQHWWQDSARQSTRQESLVRPGGRCPPSRIPSRSWPTVPRAS